jgi:hypothetical protein
MYAWHFSLIFFTWILLSSCLNPLGSNSSAQSSFLVPVASSIAISSGNNQVGTASAALSTFYVVVTDNNNNVMPAVTVNWSVTAGGGSLSNTSGLTDSNGLSSSTLTLGQAPAVNTVTATINGTALSVSFSASGSWDINANSYFSSVTSANGGTDPISTTDKQNINAFVVGLKSYSLWNLLLDGWLLRSTQNIGTGTNVIALVSTSDNGTLTNGPTWTATGLSLLQASNQGCNMTLNKPVSAGHMILIRNAINMNGGNGEFNWFPAPWNFTGFNASTTFTLQHTSQPGFQDSVVVDTVTGAFRMIHGGWDGTSYSYGQAAGYTTASRTLIPLNSATSLRLSSNGDRIDAAAFVFSSKLQSADIANFYSLYKNTIGAGLSLP